MDKERFLYVKGHITKYIDIFMTTIYFIAGLFAPSLYLISLGLFTLCLFVSKYICLKAIKEKNTTIRMKSFISANVLIVISAIFFAIYNIRLLIGDDLPINFGRLIAVILMVTCFIRLIFSIVNLIRYAKSDGYYQTILVINTCFTLAYLSLGSISAIVAFKFWSSDINIYVSAIVGISMGLICAIMATLNMIVNRYKKPQNKEEKASL